MPLVDIESVSSLAYKDTELTLRLPGSTSTTTTTTTTESTWSSESVSSSGQIKNSTNWNYKRGIVETVGVDFLGSKPHATTTTHEDDKLEHTKAPAVKGQIIGWPPVRSSIRKKAIKYVKVGADGEPFLRKIDLHMFTSYEQLLRVLHQMFYCFTICGGYLEQSKAEKGMEYYLPTYEDTDGDLMLVGDVPWNEVYSLQHQYPWSCAYNNSDTHTATNYSLKQIHRS